MEQGEKYWYDRGWAPSGLKDFLITWGIIAVLVFILVFGIAP